MLTKLADLDTWLGDDIANGTQPFPYARLAVFALPQEPNPEATQQLWPLGDLAIAGEAHGPGRCRIVSGTELDTIRGPVANTPTNTQWRSGDQQFHIVLRPLLPDEQTCHDLDEYHHARGDGDEELGGVDRADRLTRFEGGRWRGWLVRQEQGGGGDAVGHAEAAVDKLGAQAHNRQ